MTRTDTCRDALLMAMARGLELLLARAAREHDPADCMDLSAAQGRIQGARELLRDDR